MQVNDDEQKIIEMHVIRRKGERRGDPNAGTKGNRGKNLPSSPEKLIKEAATRSRRWNINQLEIQFQIFNSSPIKIEYLLGRPVSRPQGLRL